MKLKPIKKLRKTDTITVTITREFFIRIRIGIFLFKVAGWIMGCAIEIEGPDIQDPIWPRTEASGDE